MKSTFLLLDKDGDGMLSKKELIRGYEMMGINITEDKAETIITHVDCNNNEMINYSGGSPEC